MAKRKREQTSTDNTQKRPRKGQQSPEEKCVGCLKDQCRCDETFSFTEKCSHCVKAERKCCLQSEEKEKGLLKDQKCVKCIKKRRTCTSTLSFTTKCSTCVERGYRCYPQEQKLVMNNDLSKNQKYAKCFRDERRYFDILSFTTKCIACEEIDNLCVEQGKTLKGRKGYSQPKEDKCNRCALNELNCDGKTSYNAYIRRK